MLVVDDAHWLDVPTLRWLAFLSGRLEGEPLLLALAARQTPEPDDAWDAVREQSAWLQPQALSVAGVAAALAAAFAQWPSPKFAMACVKATQGNPLLIAELATALMRQGVVPDDAGAALVEATPQRGLTPSIALRMRRLGPEARFAAHALAVLGASADLRRISRLTAQPPTAIQAGLDALAVDGLIAAEAPWSFVHPLVRTAAYEDLPPATRAAWHGEAARVLERDGEHLEPVAAHLLRAPVSADPWTVEVLGQAASLAERRAAPMLAAAYLRRALAEPPAPAKRPALLTRLGSVELATDPSAAADDFADAMRLSADAPTTVSATLGLAQALSFTCRFAEAATALQGTLKHLPAGPDPLADEVRAALLNTARWDIQTRPWSQILTEQLQARVAAGGTLTAALHANLAVELLIEGGDRAETIRHAEAAIAAMESAHGGGAMSTPVVVGPLLLAGQPARAEAIANMLAEAARSKGQRPLLSIALSAIAGIRLMRGDVTTAMMHAEEALEHANDPVSSVYAVKVLASALLLRGDLDCAWQLYVARGWTGALPATWPFVHLQGERGRLRGLRGEVEAGLADLEAHGRFATQAGLRCPAVLPWRSRAAELLAALANDDAAQRLVRSELVDAERWGEPATLAFTIRHLAALGGKDQELALLQRALELLDGAPEAGLERIETLTALGAALRRRNQRAAARPHLREALHLAQEGGAETMRRRAHEELRAAGGRPRRSALRGADALTPSELRVARLAGEGRSNPEIARHLFVTRRTVETHLTQAYAKLGIHGRGQLTVELLSGL